MREAAEHRLHLVRARAAAEQAAGEGVRQHPGRDKAEEARKKPGQELEDEPLVRVETLGRRRGDANRGDRQVDLSE